MCLLSLPSLSSWRTKLTFASDLPTVEGEALLTPLGSVQVLLHMCTLVFVCARQNWSSHDHCHLEITAAVGTPRPSQDQAFSSPWEESSSVRAAHTPVT